MFEFFKKTIKPTAVIYPTFGVIQTLPDSTINRLIYVCIHNLYTASDELILTPDTHLINDLKFDSLDAVQLIMEFEEQFGCDISDEDAEKCCTVGDIIVMVNKYNKQHKINI